MQSRLEQSKNWDMGKGDEPTSESWNPSSVSWWVMGRPTINLKIHSRRHEPRQQHLDTIRFRNGGATQMTGNNHSLTRSIWWFRPLSRVLFSFFFPVVSGQPRNDHTVHPCSPGMSVPIFRELCWWILLVWWTTKYVIHNLNLTKFGLEKPSPLSIHRILRFCVESYGNYSWFTRRIPSSSCIYHAYYMNFRSAIATGEIT